MARCLDGQMARHPRPAAGTPEAFHRMPDLPARGTDVKGKGQGRQIPLLHLTPAGHANR